MRNGILLGIFLLGIAATASAFGEWYWVSCSGTYNMGDSGGMDLIPCAISQSTGGGGSKVITGDYCLQFTEWRTAGNFRVHAMLYKGVDCENWSPGDYCYDKMWLGGACNKYVDWGERDVWLGDLSYYYITLDYGTSQWGPLVFAHGGSPLTNRMGFKIRVSADEGKRGAGKGVIRQASQLQSAYAPLTASAVRTTQKKLRRR